MTVRSYSLAQEIDGRTYEPVIYARSREDAETIAELIGATVMNELEVYTVCPNCLSPMVCLVCEEYYEVDTSDPRFNN